MTDLSPFSWPASRLGEALECAARHDGLSTVNEPLPRSTSPCLGGIALQRWIEAAGASMGLAVKSVALTYGDMAETLTRAAPALVRLPSGSFLLLAGGHGHSVSLVAADLEVHLVPIVMVHDALCGPLETRVAEDADRLRDLVDDPLRCQRVRRAFVRERLSTAKVADCWLLGASPGSSFWAQLRVERIVSRAALLLVAHAAELLLTIGAWYILGSRALDAQIDSSWLVAWALCLISALPFGVLTVFLQGRIALGVGILLKRRLLVGTLRIDEQVLRREGSGQLLGRALESGAVEALASSGGGFAVLALVDVVVLACVLPVAPGGACQAFALAVWTLLTISLALCAYRRSVRSTEARRQLTDDLIEKMAGHRTRLAQQSPERWHDGEDASVARYSSLSRATDTAEAWVRAMPQAWLLVGLAACAPGFVLGTSSPASLAVAVGGALLGGAALTRLSAGLSRITAAAIAWREVAPLFDAASRDDREASSSTVTTVDDASSPDDDDEERGELLIDASDLVFSYPRRSRPAVLGASLEIRTGDRILLEGPSGGGKSTLASLLSGLRQPDSGLLLLDGLDWRTLGPAGWRERVATAPQYDVNHVLTGTLLFNLLMGRRWPPTPEDIEDAREVCDGLGLGDLVERMPSGLMQMVGESGWRLSHGERSRLFLARAVLQGAKLLVLDETFAALDAETLEQCLRWVLDRAPALVIVGHP